MCGRFALKALPRSLMEFLGITPPQITPRSEIFPLQESATVLYDQEKKAPNIHFLKWGLIPFWAKDKKFANKAINARAETIDVKPTFKAAFRLRRCLIPATGFYEWKTEGKRKAPYYFAPADQDEPLVLAGLWEDWRQGDEHVRTFAIVTTTANETMAPIHDRMPVILQPDSWERWLDPKPHTRKQLEDLLRPTEPDFLQACEYRA